MHCFISDLADVLTLESTSAVTSHTQRMCFYLHVQCSIKIKTRCYSKIMKDMPSLLNLVFGIFIRQKYISFSLVSFVVFLSLSHSFYVSMLTTKQLDLANTKAHTSNQNNNPKTSKQQKKHNKLKLFKMEQEEANSY